MRVLRSDYIREAIAERKERNKWCWWCGQDINGRPSIVMNLKVHKRCEKAAKTHYG